ncbi:ArsR family transcriptional regulator [Streptomyces capoamus]|uniref:ArsR family transcriptional regulator n=1 Tax=Streptomyces capoamus TaxID=68183 RepID=A0A919C4J1_9ACTN|nr:helix-turn-helix domain-containing protein [Streptomyces capoamus]GGW13597.1 ArsR family transcriptional regulator [Streptomyces libani subsp. rufus]GHG41453.1 ArsR family transcriptional regulator [Streptomyces capoamus]
MASDPTAQANAADSAIDSVSVLSEDSRRRMFAFIRRAGRAVTRDEAAASVGISRKLAAFHLDKLVDAGLLRARYETPGGIRKVGRQPKVYEPTDAQITVSIPDRRHELLADLLLDAVLTEGTDENAAQAAVRTAEQRGRQLGEAARKQTRPGRLGPERGLTTCESLLDEYGYEPVRETPTQLRLRNCPFHPLAAKAPELVCGMNHAFLSGYLHGLEVNGVQAVLAPEPGECCVRLGPSDPDRDDETRQDH